ncbi:hypothetical protein GEMRC1_009138 [Eukaryota sp. GEM-RC1]
MPVIYFLFLIAVYATFVNSWSARVINSACTMSLQNATTNGYWEDLPNKMFPGPSNLRSTGNIGEVVYEFQGCRGNENVTFGWNAVSGFQIYCRPDCHVVYRSGTHFTVNIHSPY